jgi:DNA-binding response OmpR family regulator
VEAFSLGADEYIVKPFSPRDLAARIRSAMRQHAELQVRASAGGAR